MTGSRYDLIPVLSLLSIVFSATPSHHGDSPLRKLGATKHYILKIGQYKLGLLLALLLLPLSLLLLGLVLDLEQLTLVLYLPYLPYSSYCYGWETRLGRNRINGYLVMMIATALLPGFQGVATAR